MYLSALEVHRLSDVTLASSGPLPCSELFVQKALNLTHAHATWWIYQYFSPCVIFLCLLLEAQPTWQHCNSTERLAIHLYLVLYVWKNKIVRHDIIWHYKDYFSPNVPSCARHSLSFSWYSTDTLIISHLEFECPSGSYATFVLQFSTVNLTE